MYSSLLLALVDDAHGAAEGVVANLQRVALGAQHVLPVEVVLLVDLHEGGLQGRVGARYVGLRHLDRRLLPYFQGALAALGGLGVLGAQLAYGVERSLVVVVLVERVDALHQGLRQFVGRGLAGGEAGERCKQ